MPVLAALAEGEGLVGCERRGPLATSRGERSVQTLSTEHMCGHGAGAPLPVTQAAGRRGLAGPGLGRAQVHAT
eukprot:1267166-Rhodomonas_salina.2